MRSTAAWFGAGLLVCSLASHAAGDLRAAPNDLAACITQAAGAPDRPDYPAELYETKSSGTVRVALEFTSVELAPAVKVVQLEGDERFQSVVREHVGRYRVAAECAARLPLRAVQVFSFVPNDGRKVSWSRARGGDVQSDFVRGCVRHVRPGTKPDLGRARFREGRVLARIRFEASGQPPIVSIPDSGAATDLVAAVRTYAEGYRFDCDLKEPVFAQQLFSFVYEDSSRKILRDTDLKTWLAAVRDPAGRPVYFDLDRMACPFEVRLTYWQPAMQHDVGEIGASVAVRRPFLDWLASLSLDVPKGTANAILGEELTIRVPCGKIDL
jgi:hypothetical protein